MTDWLIALGTVLSGVGAIAVAGVALRGFGKYQDDLSERRARWLSQLFKGFYEATTYKAIRKELDWRNCREIEQRCTLAEYGNGEGRDFIERLTDYLNFFHMVSWLRDTDRLSSHDIERMFSYYLALLGSHGAVVRFMATEGFEQTLFMVERSHPYLAVYGTLRMGAKAHAKLQGAEYLGKRKTYDRGMLFKYKETEYEDGKATEAVYAGCTLDGHTSSNERSDDVTPHSEQTYQITVECYYLPDAPRLLRKLDKYEECELTQEGPLEPGSFERVLVELEQPLHDTKRKRTVSYAWMYVWHEPRADAEPLPTGDWNERNTANGE